VINEARPREATQWQVTILGGHCPHPHPVPMPVATCLIAELFVCEWSWWCGSWQTRTHDKSLTPLRTAHNSDYAVNMIDGIMRDIDF